MLPSKRLKLKDENIDEDRNKVLELEPLLRHLDSLPPEILEKIFQYLTPEHLVLIYYTCTARVARATALKKADFSESKTADEAFMNLFFSAIRSPSLQEIYLPQMIYIDGQSIFKYVSRCKFLTKLNISYRGLSYVKILHILEKCKSLRELNYNVAVMSKANYELSKTTHNLKKITLNIDRPSAENVYICQDLLSRCNTEAEVYLNFTSYTFTFNLKREEDKRLVSDIIMNVFDEDSFGSPLFVENIFRRFMANFSCEDFAHQKEEYRGFCVSLSKIYAIFNELNTSSVSSILPATPLHTLVLTEGLYNDNELERKFLFKLTEEASLKNLKHLTVLNKVQPISDHLIEEEFSDFLSIPIVPDIFSKCSYLQEVVFTDFHFKENCVSLFGLKYLKVLTLPQCAMDTRTPRNNPNFLEDLVENCKCIESFTLGRCCYNLCPSVLPDVDLNHIQKWSNLKSLSVSRIASVRTCTFLPHVAANTKLTTLCLKDMGNYSVCHFTSNLCYAIKLARNLKFLQINQEGFHPAESLFWKNIAEVKTLEGICIYCCHSAYVNSAMIISSVKKLKMLHVFHLRVPNSPECLAKNIRKVISENGIRNPSIEINKTNLFGLRQCQFDHYPFIVPPYHHHL